ncbi:hypothetical protein GGI07_003444 [Coemansia sp. Benny D115]|nr:hypothetical protein GGI07_003444 [Coemansia sp. Benny D115]
MSCPSRPALPVNRYLQRMAVKEGTCFMCGGFTANIFLTEQTAPLADWFFVCPKHTTLASFCSQHTEQIEAAPQESPNEHRVSDDEGKVAKKEKAKDAENAKEQSTVQEGRGKEAVASSDKGQAAAGRKWFVLQKDVFYLRQRPFIKRWEKEQADLLAQRLPSAPRHVPK